jgi:hypothetical protein
MESFSSGFGPGFLDEVALDDRHHQVRIPAARFLRGLMDSFKDRGIRRRERSSQGELGDFPGDRLLDANAFGKEIH